MQPAEHGAVQRVNVVNLMLYACGLRKSHGFFVDGSNGDSVCPLRRGIELCRNVPHSSGSGNVWMRSLVGAVLGVQFGAVLRSVSLGTRQYLVYVFAVTRSIFSVYFVASSGIVGALLCYVFVSLGVIRSFASSERVFFVGGPPTRRSESAWSFHFDSMCRSMIRRTSSAMEIPRRLASRLRNWRCGSVNEIICFVIEFCAPLHFNQQFVVCGSGNFKIDAAYDVVSSEGLNRYTRLARICDGLQFGIGKPFELIPHSLSIPQGIPCA